jgi:hypothetical protein
MLDNGRRAIRMIGTGSRWPVSEGPCSPATTWLFELALAARLVLSAQSCRPNPVGNARAIPSHPIFLCET